MLLLLRKLKRVFGMQTLKVSGPTVNIVLAHAKFKIHYVHGVNFLHFVVAVRFVQAFGYGFAGGVKHPLEKIYLVVKLQFNYYLAAVLLFCKHIHLVVFVVFASFVALALQDFFNYNIATEEFGQKTRNDVEIGFATQLIFHRVVKGKYVASSAHYGQFRKAISIFSPAMQIKAKMENLNEADVERRLQQTDSEKLTNLPPITPFG
jgi:hypothetical protein